MAESFSHFGNSSDEGPGWTFVNIHEESSEEEQSPLEEKNLKNIYFQ